MYVITQCCIEGSDMGTHRSQEHAHMLQSPKALPSQLVKCVMKRENDSTRPKAVKYTLRMGDRVGSSTFMMTALQASR